MIDLNDENEDRKLCLSTGLDVIIIKSACQLERSVGEYSLAVSS